MWLPGLVFLGLALWLVRKLWKAARTEDDLDAERLQGALADELKAARARAAGTASLKEPQPAPLAVVKEPEPDLADVSAAHLEIIRGLVAEREAQVRSSHKGPADVAKRVELLWARSNGTHAVWCERRHAATRAAAAMTRDVICVAQIDKGKVVERWFFG